MPAGRGTVLKPALWSVLRVDGRALAVAGELFHDALNRAYLELATHLHGGEATLGIRPRR